MVSVESKIKELIENKLGINSRRYSENSNFREDLGCDSLDLIDLIMEVEREFNIAIPDSDIDQVSTVKGLINYVKERV
jgi:acyl carrier protein